MDFETGLILVLLLGIAASIVGALPLGLVNLSVMESGMNVGNAEAFKISLPAALMEVLFALIAVQSGMWIGKFVESSKLLQAILVIFFILLGIYLFSKKSKKTFNASLLGQFNSWIRGFLLQVMSPQVLIYWLIVIPILQTNMTIIGGNTAILLSGVFIGKLIVLLVFGRMGRALHNRRALVGRWINKFMGFLMLFTGAYQGIKFFLLA